MDSQQNEFRNKRYELLILAASIISLVNILLMFIPLKEELHDVVGIYDYVLSIFLMGDFIYRLAKSPNKTDYLIKGFGWLDFGFCLQALDVGQIVDRARILMWLVFVGFAGSFV